GREESRVGLQDRVRALKLGDFALELADLLGLSRSDSLAVAGIDLGAADSLSQRLRGADAQQRSDAFDRRPLRLTIRPLGDHAHRPRLQLRRVALRCVPWHDSNSPNNQSLRTR